MEEKRLVSTWETLYKDNEGQGQVETLHKYTYAPDLTSDMFINQARPVSIPPRRTKPITRDYRLYASIPDEQIGYRYIDGRYHAIHCERAMEVARCILRDVRPDVIVQAGDTADLAEMSRFDPDSDHFNQSIQKTIDRSYQWSAELRADHPEARIVQLEGNHNRLTKFVLNNAAKLYNVKQANMPESWSVVSWPFLTRMDETRTEWVSGYPANEFVLNDDLVFVHGKKARSNGSTAALYSNDYPETNVVFGHVHRQEMHTRTTRAGKYLVAATFGTLARIDGAVPSYGNGVDDRNQIVTRQENWQQGIGLIYDYGNGRYQFDPIQIKNGKAFYNGKVYS